MLRFAFASDPPMPATLPPRRSFKWSYIALSPLVSVFFGSGFYAFRAQRQKRVPSAFLLAVDATSAAKMGWREQTVPTVRTVWPGKTIELPAGAHFTLLHLDGEIETLSGPAQIPGPQVAPPEEV